MGEDMAATILPKHNGTLSARTDLTVQTECVSVQVCECVGV